MEYNYFNYNLVPNDVWRLIFKRLHSLTDLRSFNSINKSCHNSSKFYLHKEKLWLHLIKSSFGLAETKFIPPILPSKLFRIKQLLRPSVVLQKDIKLDETLKIIVVGDGGCGKSTYSKLISGNQVNKQYLPTIGCEILKFSVRSTNRTFQLAIWDTAGPEKFGMLRDGYYMGAVGAIILSDLTSRFTIKNIPNWVRDVRRVCQPDIPVAICVNKIDLLPEKAKPVVNFSAAMRIAQKKNTMFCEMSNWAKYGVHEPLIWILQQLTGDNNLQLVFPPMIGERNGEVNATVFNAAIAARKKIAKLYYEDDDDFDEPIPKPAEDYAQKKRKVLEDVIKSCSPRVKNVMEAMLTGVRLAPVIAMRNHHPLQRPSLLFVEGLTCQEFHPIDRFTFVQPFLDFYRQHEEAIVMETKALMGSGDLDRITSSVKGSWKSFYFVESGKTNLKAHEIAPLLTQLLTRVTSLMTCGFGYAYISILEPHTFITSHCGPCNIKQVSSINNDALIGRIRLRCHLPLIVPSSNCTIRVGSTSKSFAKGELLIFDDSVDHEVQNGSDEYRVVLLFDIWHPDLTSDEISSFNAYF